MVRILCACAQKLGTSCSHTKLQVARIAQCQSSSATQTTPLFFFFSSLFLLCVMLCLNFGCVVFVIIFIDIILSAS